MRREDLKGILPNASDEEIDALMGQFGKELNPLKSKLAEAEKERDKSRADLTEALAGAAGLQSQLSEAEERLKAGMSAEELLAQQRAEAEAREREFLLKSNGLDARARFVDAGCFGDDEIATLVEQVVGEDRDSTLAKADAIIGAVRRHGESVEARVKDELLKGNPKPAGSAGGGAPMSKKDFLKLPYAEQLQLKRDNPQIMSELTE